MSSAATKSEQIKKKHFIGWNESAQLSEQTRIFHSHPVVGDYTNTMKTTFLFKFGFFTSFFSNHKFTGNQRKVSLGGFSLFSCLCLSMLFESYK